MMDHNNNNNNNQQHSWPVELPLLAHHSCGTIGVQGNRKN